MRALGRRDLQNGIELVDTLPYSNPALGGIHMATGTMTPGFAEYGAAFPLRVQMILKKIRATVISAAPHAQELISYRMPAFAQDGILVYFAAFKGHIGLYPPVSGDARLEKRLAVYAGPKGNLRFPLDQPIPYDLIRRIVLLRVKQNLAKAAARKRARQKARRASSRAGTRGK
jgi:uncharacterized protein YdhG (YjbR/CyaY superfamily)